MIFTALTAIIGAYLLGSVNFAVIFTRLFNQKDVRDYGSGNAGSTNALRVGGKVTGICTFLCDFLKGALAAFLGRLIFEYIFDSVKTSWSHPIYGAYICGIFCLIGHVFPLFFNFKGGKGVAAGAGVFLSIFPIATVVGLAVFGIVFVFSKTVSVSSLAGTLAVVVTSLIFYDRSCSIWPQLIFAVILFAIIYIKHKDNIVRVVNGTESKFDIGGK